MKRKLVCFVSILLLFAWTVTANAGGSEVFLSDLTPRYENNIHGCLQFDKVYWQPDIVIDGIVYSNGIGMHAPDYYEIPNPNCQYYAERPFVPGRGTAAWQL